MILGTAALCGGHRRTSSGTTIEVVTLNCLKSGALETIVAAKRDVFNHILETVPSKKVRPCARYFHSVQLLAREGTRSADPDENRAPLRCSSRAPNIMRVMTYAGCASNDGAGESPLIWFIPSKKSSPFG
jgi:hypothetical protein